MKRLFFCDLSLERIASGPAEFAFFDSFPIDLSKRTIESKGSPKPTRFFASDSDFLGEGTSEPNLAFSKAHIAES